MSMLRGAFASGSDGASWSLRKSGLLMLGAAAVPKASIHAFGWFG